MSVGGLLSSYGLLVERVSLKGFGSKHCWRENLFVYQKLYLFKFCANRHHIRMIEFNTLCISRLYNIQIQKQDDFASSLHGVF